MQYEIEVHPVGDASKAGDAISVRFVQDGHYEVIIIDGGTIDSGKDLVEHIKRFYGADTVIRHAISTHPDMDHASGLREIFKNFRVQNLWIHGLWHHIAESRNFFLDKRLSEKQLQTKIREAYPIVDELITLARDCGAEVYEPFQGSRIGPFTVLSPSLRAYTRLIPQFRRTPDPDNSALEKEGLLVGQPRQSSWLRTLVASATTLIDERWDIELLRENAITAAENETSTVLYGDFGESSILLTADAGVNALTWACDYAQVIGLDLSTLSLVQVPHHGSRSNVTPAILDRLLGPRLPVGIHQNKIAVVSCPKEDETHPRKIVVNAFRRRGVAVYKTREGYFRRSVGMPNRMDEVDAAPFAWFDRVEAYD